MMSPSEHQTLQPLEPSAIITDSPQHTGRDPLTGLLNLEEVQLFMRDLDNHHQQPMEEESTPHPATSSPVPSRQSPGGFREALEGRQGSPDLLDANNNGGGDGEEDEQKFDPRSLEVELQRGKSGAKPALSYIALISFAIHSTRDQRMVLGDIYSWVSENFPYFRLQDRSWRNSIRHNLSLNECFIKAGRSENGKGNYWAIHPANVDDFRRGDFRRRRARRQVRKCNARLEQLHGHKGSAHLPGSHRGQRPCDVNSYVPMTSMTLSDAEIVAMFGKVVLRTKRVPSEYMDSSLEGDITPNPSPPASIGEFSPQPAGTKPHRPLVAPSQPYQQESLYPVDQGRSQVPANNAVYGHYDGYYGQVAPLSSYRWQHQPTEGATEYLQEGCSLQGPL